KYILFFLFLFGFSSCDPDFVEVDNATAISTANYPKTVDDLEQLLAGVYATQHAAGIFGRAIGPYSTYVLDHTCDLSWQGSPNWIQMAQNNTLPNDAFLRQIWPDLWRGVQRCNTLLAGIASVRENSPESASPAIDLIRGQTLFLRAWYYYYLTTFWGETFIVDGVGGDRLGMPIITEAANSLNATQVVRATVKETWDFIISDLVAASGLLKGQAWSDLSNKHKADEWAAKGFLAKVYVFVQDWEAAVPLLNEVISNSGKSLVSFNVYNTMFNGQHEFNNESLYELSLNVDMT